LIAYQKSRAVAKEIFKMTKVFPAEERFSLTDQVRRSSRSIGAQIAEGWAKRRYDRHFVSKLTDADGEQQETQHWIETAFDCEYIDKQQMDVLLGDLSEIGRMLQSMINKADLFCETKEATLRESEPEYFVSFVEPLITDH